MKNLSYILVVLLILFKGTAFGGIITLEGVYQGKNLYVQNPFAGSGVGFCATEVLVNDVKSTDEIQSSAFEIDLSVYKLKIGDKVKVVIKHKDDCKPKVLNPENLKPTSTFEVVAFKAEEGVIKFTVKGESGSLPFVVEQFRWNKWVKAGEVQGKGTAEENNYSMKINNHSGINKFRIQQTDYRGPKYSNTIQFRSSTKEVTFYPVKASKDLIFSDETMYEIFDQYGNLVKKGVGTQVDISSMPKGPYYLNYDNKTDNFIRK